MVHPMVIIVNSHLSASYWVRMSGGEITPIFIHQVTSWAWYSRPVPHPLPANLLWIDPRFVPCELYEHLLALLPMQLWHRLRPVHHHMFYLRLCSCAMEPSYLLCIRKVMYLQHRKANTPEGKHTHTNLHLMLHRVTCCKKYAVHGFLIEEMGGLRRCQLKCLPRDNGGACPVPPGQLKESHTIYLLRFGEPRLPCTLAFDQHPCFDAEPCRRTVQVLSIIQILIWCHGSSCDQRLKRVHAIHLCAKGCSGQVSAQRSITQIWTRETQTQRL